MKRMICERPEKIWGIEFLEKETEKNEFAIKAKVFLRWR